MIQKIKELLICINEWTVNKLGLLIAWAMIYFAPLVPFMLVVTAFIGLDYITGISAAKKRGEEITSKRRKDSITKTLAYQATLITAYFVEKHFIPEFPCLKLVAGFIAYVEVTSIDENVKTITGKSILGELIKKFPQISNKKR
jgi:hypothetical protein